MRRVRLVTFWRTFKSGGSKTAQYVFGGIFGLIVAGTLFGFSLWLFNSLSGSQDEVAVRLLAGVCTLAAVGLSFVGLATALYTLYLSTDLDILSSMPVRERTIFAYKFWETLFGNAGLFLVVVLPVLLAFGVGTGASVVFYLFLAVVSVLLLMVPTGICVLLIMPSMRLIPAGKAKEAVAAIGALLGALLYVGWLQVTGPSDTGGQNLSSVQTLIQSPILNVPPGGWAADALSGAANLEWGRLLAGLLPLTALSTILYAVCLGTATWAYSTGRARATESGGRVRGSGWVEKVFGWLPPDIGAVASREILSLPRDLRRMATAIVPVIMLAGIVVVNTPGATLDGSFPFLQLLPYLTAGGLAALATSQVSLLSVGIEGRGYWFLAAAPLSAGRLLAGKWAAAVFVGTLAAAVGCVLVSVAVGFSVTGFLVGLVAGISGSAVVGLYSIGISAMFPNFDWENPNKATATSGGFLMLGCFIGLGLLAALSFALVFLLGNFIPLWLAATGAAVVWVAAAATVGYAVASAGAERLKRLDWEL